MMRHYIEFEFRVPTGSHYWLPLIAETDTYEDAIEIRQRVENGIDENGFEIVGRLGPILENESIYPILLRRHLLASRSGKLCFLDVNEYTVKQLDDADEIALSDELENQPDTHDTTDVKGILASINQRRFPVRRIRGSKHQDCDAALLMINVYLTPADTVNASPK